MADNAVTLAMCEHVDRRARHDKIIEYAKNLYGDGYEVTCDNGGADFGDNSEFVTIRAKHKPQSDADRIAELESEVARLKAEAEKREHEDATRNLQRAIEDEQRRQRQLRDKYMPDVGYPYLPPVLPTWQPPFRVTCDGNDIVLTSTRKTWRGM